jgi:shikimate kinase
VDRHVALIGFMGAGKSSVGRRLALEMGLPFVDTDEAIVAEHGPIPALFEQLGESGFRECEHIAVRAALEGPRAVIALGGGAVTHEPTRLLLNERTLRVFLDVPLEVIFARLRYSNVARPMLGKAPTEARMRTLFEARLPLYREADIVADCGRRTSSSVARHVAELLRANQPLPTA